MKQNEFYLHGNKNNFCTNGFALSLALIERLGVTRKQFQSGIRYTRKYLPDFFLKLAGREKNHC